MPRGSKTVVINEDTEALDRNAGINGDFVLVTSRLMQL